MRPRRTAFIIHALKLGGSEKFFISLVNNFYRRGLHPLVIVLEKENPLLGSLDHGVEWLKVTRKFKYDLSVSFRIRAVLKQYHVDTVFCVEPYSFFLARMANLFDPNLKFFLSLHNSLPIGLKKYLLEMTYLRFLKSKDQVIFICNYQRDYFLKNYFFSPLHSFVIHNGVDTDHFSPTVANRELTTDQHSWKKTLGIENEKVILMIGRISPEKGQAYAIKALAELHRMEFGKPHLVIVGEGSQALTRELKDLVANLQLAHYVHFEGGQQEVRQYLLYADIFVMTSVSETFSLAALEALSMGIPCSLTRIGGAAEMISEKEMGELCTARDIESIAASWKLLLTSQYDRNTIRHKTMSRFSDTLMLNRYEELLKYS